MFICYKETDANGRRTQDSVLAQELYYGLKNEGFKVFFSRITLEDKLGSAYEPYIFAALNSAKVMVVLGTRPEHFNAVWVKNEWSRYLSLIKQGKQKTLIPAYRDMDPYDLPTEFSHLQAQDMSKLGFMQDLVRGVKKIINTDASKTSTVIKETPTASANTNVAPLLDRVFMFLEDGDWASANEYCEKVLDIDPKNAQAYLGKLMAELKAKSSEQLKNSAQPFDGNLNYQKIVRFGDEKLKKTLQDNIEYIKARNEKARQEQEKFKREAEEKERQEREILRREEEERRRKAEEERKRIEEEQKKCEALFKEYKEALKNENNYSRQKSDANSKLNSLNGVYNNLVNLKNNWQGIERELYSLNEKIKSVQTEISSLQTERSGLGIFAMKRKKEIDEKINTLNAEQESLKNSISTVQKNKLGYNNVTEVDNKINSMLKDIDEQKKFIEKLNALRTSQIVRNELSVFAFGKEFLCIFDALVNAKKGECVKFGSYEQDNNTSNGKEPIEWKVLDVQGGKKLLISKYALDFKLYNTSKTDVTWETCTLRKWLNTDFINSAFTANEKSMIPTITVLADENPRYSTNPGNPTQDKVFLLSIPEAKKYFGSNEERQCKATKYAIANDAFINTEIENYCWWLRSPGGFQTYAAYGHFDGDVVEFGLNVAFQTHAVRPALWIQL